MFEVSAVEAVMAGVFSFLLHCNLPIVPFYLNYLASVGMNQIASGAVIDRMVRTRAVVSATFFAAGVITIFMGLGANAMGKRLAQINEALSKGMTLDMVNWVKDDGREGGENFRNYRAGVLDVGGANQGGFTKLPAGIAIRHRFIQPEQLPDVCQGKDHISGPAVA